MSNLYFDKENLEHRLSPLTDDQRTGFGLLCCERMMPNYTAFSRHTGWGDVSVLRRVLDQCWENFVSGTPIDWQLMKTQCERATPDSEDFQTILLSPALDAAVSIATLIELLETREVKHALTIASLARDTVDMYVQELEKMPPNTENIEDEIQRHPLMQAELQSQQDDIAKVAGVRNKELFREHHRDRGTSNIAVC